MKTTRREILVLGAGAAAALALPARARAEGKKCVAIATWPHGLPAIKKTLALLAEGESALEAAEKGVNVAEDDPEVNSVGLGGFPNAEGVVQLDGAIMR